MPSLCKNIFLIQSSPNHNPFLRKKGVAQAFGNAQTLGFVQPPTGPGHCATATALCNAHLSKGPHRKSEQRPRPNTQASRCNLVDPARGRCRSSDRSSPLMHSLLFQEIRSDHGKTYFQILRERDGVYFHMRKPSQTAQAAENRTHTFKFSIVL
jgi:hypothetical protein